MADKVKSEKYLEPELQLSKTFSDRTVYLFVFLIGFLILLLGGLVFAIPFLIKAISEGESIDSLEVIILNNQGLISCLSEGIGIIILCILLRLSIKNDIFRFKYDWKRCLIVMGIGMASMLLLVWVFNLVYNSLGIVEESSNQSLIEEILSGDGKWSMIISTALIAPIFEELVFRKSLMGFFGKTKIANIVSILICTLAFALIHMTSDDFTNWVTYIYFLNYFALSLILVLSYYYSKSNIYVSVAVHIFNNILSLLLFYFMV